MVKVSVIVPCHNAAPFLADALESVRGQTLSDFECLVVDDASSDGSPSVAQHFAQEDPRIRVIALSARQGVSAARNRALEEARGQWIALIDADDIFLADRLTVLTGLGERFEADMVFDDQIITEFPARTSRRRAFGFNTSSSHFTQEDFFEGSRLFRQAFPAGYMKPLLRRKFVLERNASYDPAVASGEDFLFYAQLFSANPTCIATRYAGYVYRRRRGSVSRGDELLRSQVELGERVLRSVGDRLSPKSRAALAARRRDFEDLAQALPAARALQSRDWRSFAGAVAENPRVIRTLAKRLRSRALRLGRTWRP